MPEPIDALRHTPPRHLKLVAIDRPITTLCVAVPLAIYVLAMFTLYAQLTRTFDPFHLLLILLSAAVLGAGVVMVAAGAPLVWSLLVVALTPWVTVVGYETVGHRHNEDVLASLEVDD